MTAPAAIALKAQPEMMLPAHYAHNKDGNSFSPFHWSLSIWGHLALHLNSGEVFEVSQKYRDKNLQGKHHHATCIKDHPGTWTQELAEKGLVLTSVWIAEECNG